MLKELLRGIQIVVEIVAVAGVLLETEGIEEIEEIEGIETTEAAVAEVVVEEVALGVDVTK